LVFINESENRIEQNEKYEKEGLEGDEEDQLDEEDINVLKEENKCEADLQIHLAEILGVIFKTHKEFSRPLCEELLSKTLPEFAKVEIKRKQKFILFLLDDMVEFLGPEFLGVTYTNIVTQICQYSGSKYAAIRQAAVYGIGMIAQHGGVAFLDNAMVCLTSLKTAIDFPIDNKTKEKKTKLNQYNYARENGISALGKILKYQPSTPDIQNLLNHWITLMPLTNDMEEAKIMNEFLADCLLKAPQDIIGAGNERLEQIVVILGEVCHKKQSSEGTLDKLSIVLSNLGQNQQFNELCMSKLSEQNKTRITNVQARCNEEVRARVQASMQ